MPGDAHARYRSTYFPTSTFTSEFTPSTTFGQSWSLGIDERVPFDPNVSFTALD